MQIRFNGQPQQLPERSTILQLLDHARLADRRVAVEVNGTIVPRSRHAEHVLCEGDTVEVVHALGGG